MNLSVALSMSRQNLNKEVSGLRLRHDPTMAYWCDELGIDASASQLATEKLIKNLAANNNQRVVSLLESLRRELAQIASLAGSISQKLETASDGGFESNMIALEMHLNRYVIKSFYIEVHLREYLSVEQMHCAGLEFVENSRSLADSMRVMDSGS